MLVAKVSKQSYATIAVAGACAIYAVMTGDWSELILCILLGLQLEESISLGKAYVQTRNALGMLNESFIKALTELNECKRQLNESDNEVITPSELYEGSDYC